MSCSSDPGMKCKKDDRGNLIRQPSLAYPVLIIILCIIAAGCLGVRTPPVSHPAPPAVLVDYHRSGGIAGVDDRLVMFDNGATVVSTTTESNDIVLNASEITKITSLFDQAHFSQLQENYPAPHGSADLFHYSISYQGKTVVLDESAYPVSIQPIIDELQGIVTGVQPGATRGTAAGYITPFAP
jgi:hypothetical protein